MHRLGLRIAAALAALCFCVSVAAQESTERLPNLLRDWVDWVRHDHETAACPLLLHHGADDGNGRVCAWPGELAIQAGPRGARFTLRWMVYAKSAIPLPGNAEAWPQQVRANALPVPVVADESGRPVIWLEPGTYQLEGQIAWARRPESLPIPQAIALVALAVDGAAVFPIQREGDALWFGQAESAPKEADSLEVRVYRKLADGAPGTLVTQIQLDVSGEGREEALGKPLPAGFVPTAIGGDLPAKLDADGTLKVQVRPGSHRITLAARAESALAEIARPAFDEPWPAQEIWSYEADPRLRVTTPNAAHPIDPSQSGVPGEWAALPAFLMERDDKLAVEERSRGLSPQDQNRLVLNRELWLDFAGGAYRSKDRVSGRMVRDWRLDVASPYQLVRADENGDGLLVTRGAKEGLTGVEVRDLNVNVGASTRIAGGDARLPITGWQQSFDSVATVLNMPPGYRLYAALGADHAPGAWLDRWNLLDVFLVAITTLLAGWLGGRVFAALALGYLVLGYHESDAPGVALLATIVLALLAKLMPAAGWFGVLLRGARNVAAFVLALIALNFAAEQVRLALYPQLERWSADAVDSYGYAQSIPIDQVAPAAPAPMEAPVMQEESKAVGGAPMARNAPPPPPKVMADQVATSASANAYRKIARQRYATNTLIQAGAGEPAWGWSTYNLSFSGPVLPAQTMRLVISPPWLTSATRIALVVLLALLVARFAELVFGRRLPFVPGGSRAIAGAGIALLAAAALFGAPAARAQGVPTDEMLAELSKRVLEAPRCVPNCAYLASAEVAAEGDTVRVALELHAADKVGVPLPGAEALLAIQSLRVDGIAESGVRRDESGQAWIVVARGVHRIELVARAAAVDKIGLAFPLKPAHVVFSGKEWEAEGLREERMLTNTLELVRVRKSTAGAATAAGGGGQQFPPFVRVERTIELGIDWTVTTNVIRLAPEQAAFSVALPLLPGERVLSSELKVADGKITVPVQAGVGVASWTSQLERSEKLELEAPPLAHHAEVWRVSVGSMWNLVASGVPAVYPEGTAQWVYEFHPLPGEKLALAITRPEAVTGSTLAIDAATLTSAVGKRATDHTLDLTLRSTQGGQHVIEIPADAEVLEVNVAGQPLNVRPEKGKLGVPIKPGSQAIRVRWRENAEIGLVARTPVVALHAPSSNLRLNIALPEDRWVLRVHGPRVGPAVLYWGELLLMIAIAYGLSRMHRTPLRFVDWLLLGLGFSTASWGALLVVVLWLLALDWRARRADLANAGWFNLRQLGLALLTFVALVGVLESLQKGLLGTPDMHLVGNNSTPMSLHWFHDRSDDAMPVAYAVSVPMWVYKALMLAWALWLAVALVRWLRWGFAAYATGGYWRARRKVVAGATAEGAAAAGTAGAAAASTEAGAVDQSGADAGAGDAGATGAGAGDAGANDTGGARTGADATPRGGDDEPERG